jgi:tungstate transport system substrate-binding protein
MVTLMLAILMAVGAGCPVPAGVPLVEPLERIRIATTTSLYDTGLWALLEPKFEREHGVELDIIYAGTGIALEWGRRGDVDAIATHCRPREEKFVAEGYGVERVVWAYNYFLIVGPADDTAGIKGLSPEDAFKRLMETGAGGFVSRGDASGTHAMEKAIWREAGFDYEAVRAAEWYIEAGKGMGPTLMMASEKQAYTLSDMGTFLAFRADLVLVPLVDEGDILLNVYTVIAINPKKHPRANIELANKLIAFLTSPEIQRIIGDYGVKEHGMALFTPAAGMDK